MGQKVIELLDRALSDQPPFMVFVFGLFLSPHNHLRAGAARSAVASSLLYSFSNALMNSAADRLFFYLSILVGASL